tara:strand:+ start:122 stop:844 length:723 start_codon:yes stop_codon:yes gene_type:complete
MISIDTVYQKVLSLANKEQRGYITPQEFNLLAEQAQMDIFEQYFYDLNQFNRAGGNGLEYGDIMQILEEKIATFEKQNIDVSAVSGSTITLPTNIYRLGTVFYNNGTNSIIVEKVSNKQIQVMLNASLYKPTLARPVYTRSSETKIVIYPTTGNPAYSASTLNCNHTVKPEPPKWTYTIVNEQALYNNTAADKQDFQLHESDEEELIYKILELAGVIMNKPGLVQIADKEDSQSIQNEKM